MKPKTTSNSPAMLYDFLKRLSENNNREWFAAHKSEYEALRAQWIADLQRMIDAMAVWEPSLRGLEAKSCLYRIYRDTRFSTDKTPLKTYFSALISPRGRHYDGACWYIHRGLDENALYGGVWCPESGMLRKLRKAIVDNIDEWRSIVETPEVMTTFPQWWGRQLKTAPKGYDRDHPAIEYLRLTEFGKVCELGRDFFLDPAWPGKAAELCRVLKPMNDFLNYSINE